jgi:dihydrofolate synthase/folylpolyglutamate synthase
VEAQHLIERYRHALAATDALIESAYAPGGTSLGEIIARAAHRMERARSLMSDLGDPLRGVPLVHIGGTSGKGSTSVLLSSILAAAGYQTGLHTSPYLQVSTEKLQVNGQLIAADLFAGIVDEVLEVAAAWTERHGERLTYGEVWMGLIGRFFQRSGVEIGVIEVGAGGRFDLTNIITPVLSIVTSVGLDHLHTLGTTIEQIAWHKAGIIKPGVPVVTAVDDPLALPAMYAQAAEGGSELTRVIASETFEIVSSTPDGVEWIDHSDHDRVYRTGMPGRFQAVNAATAVTAARVLRSRGFEISDEAIAGGIANGRIPGRAEYVQHEPLVLLDGAHNPQKVAALALGLEELLPVQPGGRRIAVLGMLDAKAHTEAIDSLIPHVDALVLTSPHVLAKEGFAAESLGQLVRERGFAGQMIVEPEPRAALQIALDLATPLDAILVTGSLYLVGNIRSYWQPDDEIVITQTPWPRS